MLDLPGGAQTASAELDAQATIVRFEDANAGQSVLTVGPTVGRWDLEPSTLRRLACRIAGRELSAEWARFLPGVTQAPLCG